MPQPDDHNAADLPADAERLLLRVAESFARQTEVSGIAAVVCAALVDVRQVVAAGIAAYDPDRETVRIYPPQFIPGAPPDSDPIPQNESDIPALRNVGPEGLSIDLTDGSSPAPYQRFRRFGACRYVSLPLSAQDRLVGYLFCGLTGPTAPDAEVLTFLRRLANLAAPMVWTIATQERFARGDRRRDTLIGLGNVLNTSLALEDVLRSALRVLAQLGGHPQSAVFVLDESAERGRNYRVGSIDPLSIDPAAVAEAPLTGLAERVIRTGQTHVSTDLAGGTSFEDERALLAAGVRRYVCAPLLARGRAVGTLLFASSEAHPIARIDVWTYENIALQLALAIDNARQHEAVRRLSLRLEQQNVYLREEIQSQHNFGEIVGASAAMQRVFNDVRRVGPTTSTVLIHGETGVGKELIARAIHAASPRAAEPMVKLNCAAIPEGMVESELFGHERGAFTSAVERRIGRFELANGGTLFLDEVGELSASVQAKLLRVLQDGEFERLGGTKTIRTDVRLIAATNRNLLASVEAGTFRRDLYYRLAVFPIFVPALRDRREDIPLLAESFIAQFARRMGKRIESIDRGSLEELCRRDWPGNVRELRHVIERAMILCDGPTLIVEPEVGSVAVATKQPEAPLHLALVDVEAEHIRRVLRQTRGVIEGPRGAAALLGLKPSTLRFRMRRLGIRREREAS